MRTPRPINPAEPPLREDLTPGEERFIEAMGHYWEKSGIPRIGGRILGLLLLSEGPVSLDRMAELLRVSRASISTNMSQFTHSGLCEHFGIPGDRRHFYRFGNSAWNNHMRGSISGLRALFEIIGAGLSALPPNRPQAKARLHQTADFFSFLETEMASLLERWEAKSAPPRPRRKTAR